VEVVSAAVDRVDDEAVSRRLGADDVAEPEVGPSQLLAQRDDDVARLERARRRARPPPGRFAGPWPGVS